MTKAEALPVEVGVRRVEDKGGQTFVKKNPKDVVAIMSGSLKPYSYFVLRRDAVLNSLPERFKPVSVVLHRESGSENDALRVYDEAITLVFRHVDTHTNHKYSNTNN